MSDDLGTQSTVANAGGLAYTLTEARASRGQAASSEPAPTGATRYERREELGRGGMGVVCRAVDLQFSRDVALKEIRSDLSDPGHLDRFATECLITGNLEHPGIPAVYERGEIADRPFYTMRRVRGRTLKEALERARDLDERLALVPALTRVAQTLAYAHSRGVVHRDIKPSNIVLGDYGETFVLDWGIAKIRGLSESTETGSPAVGDASHETRAGAIVGTPAYMAPEQAEGRVDSTDERSDVFALGALLYSILTGRAPYAGDTADELLDKAVRCEFESVHTAAAGAPRSLRLICERAMARDSQDRFRSAGELVTALEQFTSDAVAHQDSGPVGWIARAVTVLSGLLALASVGVFVSMLPRFPELGWGAYPTVAFTVVGLSLSVLELWTKGRYRLSPLILAMAAATFLSGILAVSTGYDHVLQYVLQPEVFDNATEHRRGMTQGAKEVIGNLTLAASFAMAQLFAWAIARRRALRN